MMAEAGSADRREDRLFGPEGRKTLPKALARLRVCQAKLERQAAKAAARQQAKIDAREWHLQAAAHNLCKLHRESVGRARSATARHPDGHRIEQRTA